MNEQGTEPRLIREVAQEIFRTWPTINVHAMPYAKAMLVLERITDMYGMDSADGIVRRFLLKAHGWKGEDARRIKKELKAMLK